MSQTSAIGIVLAAGKGVRMKSDLPKAVQRIGGVPMIRLIVDALRAAGIDRIIAVVGHRGDAVQAELGDEVEYAWQREQLGTGHAVTATKDILCNFSGPVVIAPGDAPLLDSRLFEFLLQAHGAAACTIPTAVVEDPTGYGRIVRDTKNQMVRIVEHRDASPEIRRVAEVNTGIYCFDSGELAHALPKLRNANAQREYYLTDLVEVMVGAGLVVNAIPYDDPSILVGVNDRWQLAQAERLLQTKILRSHALSGVSIQNLDSTYIGPYVQIGPDVTIEPNTVILGRTSIGQGSTIGPNTRIDNCTVGVDCRIYMSHLHQASLGAGVKCGPFANIRPGTVLHENVKVGNFVEIKNSVLHREVAAGHLAYIGDAEVGENTNVGAGTITCNFDGAHKSKTKIGANVFVGSNSTLVAPIELADGAFVAAGSTITDDVPENAGAFGRARQEIKPGWAKTWRSKLGSSK